MAISHVLSSRTQADFPAEAKINKVGSNIWVSKAAGHRLYAEVLCKGPGTVGDVINSAGSLEPPFTAKQVMGHLKWIYTAGELEVNGKSFEVKFKIPKVAKPDPKTEAPKPEPKSEPKFKAVRKRPVRTKKAA